MAKKLIKPTIENLREYGSEPLTRWLITAAQERGTITYGEAKRRLEREHGFSTIFSAMMGKAAGAAMDNILAIDPNAPLINVLLVQQGDRMPGDGAGSYMARRFRRPILRGEDARKHHPEVWRNYFERAAAQVYAYRDWGALYEQVYERDFQPDPEAARRRNHRDGTERDGLPRGRRGEGENHKSLRLWVTRNPKEVLPKLAVVRTETEVELWSGDRVDAVYYGASSTVAIEVKSRDSNVADMRRGVFQCVKYRAVLQAMDAREAAPVRALLITETPLQSDLVKLAGRLKIRHIIVPQNRRG